MSKSTKGDYERKERKSPGVVQCRICKNKRPAKFYCDICKGPGYVEKP